MTAAKFRHKTVAGKPNNCNISRRGFLKVAGLASLSAVAACRAGRQLSPPPAATPFKNPDVEIMLIARQAEWELAPGKVMQVWTYNGIVPGEAIRVHEGDRVRVTLQNELREPTTIHWHGIDVPTNMDGVPDVSQPAIQPGDRFVYEFEARPAGTRWYHTHFNSVQQLDLGLSAPFVIEPATAEIDYDREYTLLLDDWATGPGAAVEDGQSDMSAMMGMMMGDTGPAYDTFTINGKAFPAAEALRVRQGERVRLRLINASNMQTFNLRLEGHRLQVTHADGNPVVSPVEVEVLPIAPAERYDVIVAADNPGKWPLYAVDDRQREGGLKTLVVYEGYEATSEAGISIPNSNCIVWTYPLGAGVDFLPPATGRTRTHELTLSGGMMGGDEWTINGKLYPDTQTLKAELNQRVRVRLFNMSMQAHPFHLHGQSFRVLSVNDQPLTAPLIKDTVDVPAMMGMVEIEFVTFNRGDWMFHCHKPMHMDGGMATLVKVG